jgi:hypothetical protein
MSRFKRPRTRDCVLKHNITCCFNTGIFPNKLFAFIWQDQVEGKVMSVAENRDIRRVGEVYVQLHAFLVSQLDESKWSSRSSRSIFGKMALVLIGHGAEQDSQPVWIQYDENNNQFPAVYSFLNINVQITNCCRYLRKRHVVLTVHLITIEDLFYQLMHNITIVSFTPIRISAVQWMYSLCYISMTPWGWLKISRNTYRGKWHYCNIVHKLVK